MDELADRLQFGIAGDSLLEQVFHRLHVVVGGALDILDSLGVGEAEVLDQAFEDAVGVLAERRYFGNAGMTGQRLQPAHFDQHPMTDQAILAEDGPQAGGLVGVAAVDGRNRGQGGEFHEMSSCVVRATSKIINCFILIPHPPPCPGNHRP